MLTELMLSQCVQGSANNNETDALPNCRPSCIRGPSKVARHTFPSSSMIVPDIPTTSTTGGVGASTSTTRDVAASTSTTRDVAASTSVMSLSALEAKLDELSAEWKSTPTNYTNRIL